jgi:glucose-1-phosphate cytidylyltransferase
MKAVILAGGLGTRLSEETSLKPKPMVEIGGKPILWHIMKIYSAHGINDFIICLGYKGYLIKEYFANYFLHMSDVTFDLKNNKMEIQQNNVEPWRVTLVDTGHDTYTGGRIKRIKDHIGDDTFCLTYGDGVANIDIKKLTDFHKNHGKLATVTGVQPPGRFGALGIQDDMIMSFVEKPKGDGGWINGGFYVLEPEFLDFIDGDHTWLEREPLQALVSKQELTIFKHSGFWMPMDTLRDKQQLEDIWVSGDVPWKVW